MSEIDQKKFSDPQWLHDNAFQALSDIACCLEQDEDKGRECLIRILEHRKLFSEYNQIVDSLIQRVGLFPYLDSDSATLSTSDLLNIESHAPDGLDGIILHSMQGKVYHALMDGANVILSAPTSFGKSLLIDAAIASGRYDTVVVIVPTIALIDETRRRLTRRFGDTFRVITHPTQAKGLRNVYVLTQERFIESTDDISPQLFVIDEFYKLSPNRGDARTFVLNHAFYKLYKSGAQFFLIGPNVSNITVDQTHLSFRYFDTNYSTVAAEVEVRHVANRDRKKEALDICQKLDSPTLIYCKSAPSAYELAQYLVENGVVAENSDTVAFSSWLAENYHPDWDLVPLLKNGLAVHHGALPRSVAYHLLRKFNDGSIRFLLCTSTIIEGVNTAAENILVYDNKVATRKFDFFTFNNIKGRAGRMGRHFVGHVFVLNYEVQQELPFIDIPAITQPEDAPEELLVQIDERELSEHSLKKLRYLHAQDYLPIELIRENAGISPEGQVGLAEELSNNLGAYHEKIAWKGFPNSEQRYATCELIYKHLMGEKGFDGIFSAKALGYKFGVFSKLRTLQNMIEDELANNDRVETPTKAVEGVLVFMRRWAEFHLPRFLSGLDKIQRHVFTSSGMTPGNYEVYISNIKRLFMPPSATILEEYGVPCQISMKIEHQYPLGDTVDEIVSNLPKCELSSLRLSDFETELLKDTLENI